MCHVNDMERYRHLYENEKWKACDFQAGEDGDKKTEPGVGMRDLDSVFGSAVYIKSDTCLEWVELRRCGIASIDITWHWITRLVLAVLASGI